MTGGTESDDSERVDVNALLEWVNLDRERSPAFLARHPDLIGDAAVAELYRQATRQPRAVQVLMLDDHAWLLRLCGAHGITDGYARYETVVEASLRARDRAEQAERTFTATADPAALAEAVRLRREIIGMVADASRSRIRAAQLDHGRVMMRAYLRSADPDDLDAAIASLTRAWQVPGAVIRTQAPIVELLARSLRMRYEHHGAPDDLDRCIGLLDETLQRLPDDSATLPGLLGATGEALRLRYHRTGDRGDLDRAVECFERAEDWTVDVLDRHAARLGDLGTGLVERFHLTGEPADLDRAVSAFDRARGATPDGSPDRAAHLVNLGNALLLRFGRTSSHADLVSAMTHLEQADVELPAESPLRHALHQGLASGHGVLYEQTSDGDLLDRAIEHAKRAVVDGPAAASGLASLGTLLVTRAERTAPADSSGLADLDRAVEAFDQAVAAEPANAPRRAGRLVSLASALATRYLRAGDSADLERAIELLRTATLTDRRAQLPGAHLDLGNVLWIRYGRSRRLDDLDEALAELRVAVATMPASSVDRPGCLNGLAVGLAERFGREGRVADLTECVAALRQAADAAPAGGPDRQVILVNLGNALRIEALVMSSLQAREEAITLLRTALEAAGPTGALRASAAYNLATALLTHTGTVPAGVEIDEAIDLMQEAVRLVGDVGIDGPRYRAGLGRALRTRYRRSPTSGDFEHGVALLAGAATAASDVDVELALAAARQWVAWVQDAGKPAAAEPAYRVALAAARRLFTEQVSIGHKRSWLRTTAGVHADAARCLAVAVGPPDRRGAALALESGRALLLAEELGVRQADVGRLENAQPALAHQYRQALEQLRAVTARREDQPLRQLPGPGPHQDDETDQDAVVRRWARG